MKNFSYLPAYEDGTDRVFRNVGIFRRRGITERKAYKWRFVPETRFHKTKTCNPTAIFLKWMRIRKETVLDC
jgi:hypothetical protein